MKTAYIARDTPDDRRLLTVLNGHRDLVLSASFSPDGTRIATGSMDQTARVWDASLGREIVALPIGGFARSVSFSPRDGSWLVTTSDDGVARIWDVSRLMQPMSELAEAPCTNFLVSYGRRFSAEEARDPLVSDLWLREHDDRDVCDAAPSPTRRVAAHR